VKNILKNIYLNFRKTLLKVVAMFIANRKVPDLETGQGIQKILFMRIDRVGDLVLSLPALRALKQKFPHCELVVLASPSNQSLLLHNPYVDAVLTYDQKNSIRNKLRIIKQLRSHRFDLAIDPYLDYELKGALISFLSGANKRLGRASYGREVFFNIEAPKIKDDQHFVDSTLAILEPLGIRAGDRTPEIFLTGNEKRWAKNWLQEKGVRSNFIVGIHPGAYYETQRWLPEGFAEVTYRLKKNNQLDLVIFGGPDDEDLVARICSTIGGEVPTYIAHDLRRFAALAYCCNALICNNSGPLHMAVALRIPTISMMGPTNRDRWMPIGNIHTVLRIDDLPCIGCNLGYCKIETHDCMRLITSSMVLGAVEDILQAGNK